MPKLTDVTHGTSYAYRKGCRCPSCKKEHYRSQKTWRDRVAQEPTPDHVHGTLNGYKIYGCRLECCAAVNRAACRKERQRKNRLRELAADGKPLDYGYVNQKPSDWEGPW